MKKPKTLVTFSQLDAKITSDWTTTKIPTQGKIFRPQRATLPRTNSKRPLNYGLTAEKLACEVMQASLKGGHILWLHHWMPRDTAAVADLGVLIGVPL